MKILFHTVLDTEDFRNAAMAREFLRRGHEVLVICHSRRHEKLFSRCAWLKGRYMNVQSRMGELLASFSADRARNILRELLPGMDVENAVQDDILFSEQDPELGIRHAASLATILIDIINEQGPFGMLYSETGYLYRHIGSMCADSKGIPFHPIESSRVNGRFVLLASGRGDWLGLKEVWKSLSASESFNPFKAAGDIMDPRDLEREVSDYLRNFHEAGMPKGTDVMLERPGFRFRALRTVLGYIYRDYLQERGEFPYTWWYPISRRAFIRRLRCLFTKGLPARLTGNNVYWNINWNISNSPKEDYVFYPMPVPWETTVRHRAPEFADNLKTVAWLSKSIPSNIKLYVKEHPINLGGTPLRELKAIAELPNVRLIDPGADSRELIAGALRTITLNGTAGLETLLLGRRPITLAPCFYDLFGFCDRAWDSENLRCLIEGNDQPLPEPEDIRNMVRAMVLASWQGDMDYSAPSKYPIFGKPENLARLARAYESAMRESDFARLRGDSGFRGFYSWRGAEVEVSGREK